eukprot:323980-Amphidinium_carterae.1
MIPKPLAPATPPNGVHCSIWLGNSLPSVWGWLLYTVSHITVRTLNMYSPPSLEHGLKSRLQKLGAHPRRKT